MYTTYEYYINEYLKGREAVIDTANFPYFERKASSIIQMYTFGRIDVNKPIIDEVQMCCCELAEHLYKQDNKDHEDNVLSEKKGEWSVTYATGKDAEVLNQNKIREIIYTWLTMTGLLYKGVY